MNVKIMQETVDDSNYWDERVVQLYSNYFADEIVLIYDNEDSDVMLKFLGCYKSIYNHDKKYDKLKPVKDMKLTQIPYFLQAIEFSEKEEDGVCLYNCRINMYPLEVDVWFKDVQITRLESSRNYETVDDPTASKTKGDGCAPRSALDI